MINIKDKHLCCGCNACVQVCPKSCIILESDEHGFMYPKVKQSECIDCGLCEKVCPMINGGNERFPIASFWGIHKNENIRFSSSSGGIFQGLSDLILSKGGYVAGAIFDQKWDVKHIVSNKKEELLLMKGAKYVQSSIGNTYVEIKNLLIKGIPVLFTGTSCQVLGLRRFLRKDYSNLICVDVVCHGVPSPLVWRNFLSDLIGNKDYVSLIDSITFKDKSDSWEKYALNIQYRDKLGNKFSLVESSKKNPYTVCFLRNLTTRPSCFNCPGKGGKCGSDITLGDFWGINCLYPSLNDGKGCSVIFAYTSKGMELLKDNSLSLKEVSFHEATIYNPSTLNSSKETKRVNKFWKEYDSQSFKMQVLKKYSAPLKIGLLMRIKNKIIQLIYKSK